MECSWAVWLVTVLASVTLLRALLSLPRKKLNLPPGPRPWPVIGNLNLIGALPHQSLHKLSLKYGPIMQLHLGSQRVVVASSANMAEQFLKTHDLAFASRPTLAAGKYTAYNYSDMLWAPYGPYFRQARKTCLLGLFSPKILDSHERLRVEEIQRLLRGLYASASGVVTLEDHLDTVGLNVVSRMVLGKTYTDETAEASVVSPVAFKEMFFEFLRLNAVVNLGDLIPWIGFLDLQGCVRRMKEFSKKSDRFLEHVLEEHQERRRRLGEEFVPQDMVDVFLQAADDPHLDVKLTRDGVKALTQDLIAASIDTTSATVGWAMAELLKQPRILDKATEELGRVIGWERWVEEKDMKNLPYVAAIVKETMRLHPISPMLVPHYSREDCNVAGYDIPAGTQVFVHVGAIGRDAAVWDTPGEFRPERFEGKPVDVKGHDFELLPFGAGRRRCPAYLLGLMLVQSILANLLHGFSWKLPGGITGEDLSMEEETLRMVVLRKFPLEVIVEPRLPFHLYS